MDQQVEVKKPRALVANKIPTDILEDEVLNEFIKALPKNYNFEIHKSIWRINEMKKILGKEMFIVHLQFPEGLLHYACMIADILKNFTGCEFVISGDVTYGACCIDDFTAEAVGAEFIIHYDLDHFIDTFELNLDDVKSSKPLYLLSTIQFNASVFKAKEILEMKGYRILVPQEKPRCAGETLGCTSPILDLETTDTVVYLCDGRFHMEGVMIANPRHKYLQYNPYTKLMLIERYDFDLMIKVRQEELVRCKIKPDTTVGVVMGVLGRQGSSHIVNRIIDELKSRNVKFITLLVSELSVEQLQCFGEYVHVNSRSVQFFVQVACPRLSIDWGKYFDKPLLTPYEFYSLIGKVDFSTENYPMDYYSDKGGEWTNYFHKKKVTKKTKKLEFEPENQPAQAIAPF